MKNDNIDFDDNNDNNEYNEYVYDVVKLLIHGFFSLIIATVISGIVFLFMDNYLLVNRQMHIVVIYTVIAVGFAIIFTVTLCTFKIIHEIKKLNKNTTQKDDE